MMTEYNLILNKFKKSRITCQFCPLDWLSSPSGSYSTLNASSRLCFLSALLFESPGQHLHRQHLAYSHLKLVASMSPMLDKYRRKRGIPTMAYTIVMILP